jgi:uncharacterized damage-inducible protein DinB
MTTTETQAIGGDTRERQDLLETLDKHRGFLRYTVRNLTDEQARQRTTVSALTLASILKHVAAVEYGWMSFVVSGARAVQRSEEEYAREWSVEPGETLDRLLEHYAEAAARTRGIVQALPSLDVEHALPQAPWFEPGARWSARRVLLHILAETAQHAGHADIIREALDGQKTMG